jgi:hypothetical protein
MCLWIKREAAALYSRIASREPVIKQDLRPSALALLQDPKGQHAPRPAMSRSRVLKGRQRDGCGGEGCGCGVKGGLAAAWFAANRVNGFVGVFAWKSKPMGLEFGGFAVCDKAW